jgi:TetR/AcrR family transcriptional regulator
MAVSEIEKGQRRTRDAERTRKAILDAGERIFAQSGFAGARFDAIAEASGYNKSLIGQYFGDKVGLYTEVLKRTDGDLRALNTRVLAPWLGNEGNVSSTPGLRSLLETVVETTFTYLLEHPNFLRILTWEMADGWQTYAKIFPGLQKPGLQKPGLQKPGLQKKDTASFTLLFHHGEQAGLLRPGFIPLIRLAMITQICQSYLACLPLYQMMLSEENVFTEQALSLARQQLVTFIVGGMMNDTATPQS